MSISQPILSLDSFNQNVISVLDRVLRSDPLKFPWNKSPSASIALYHGEKLNILLKSPISFLDIRIQMTNPFLPAHRKRFKEFSLGLTVELIRNSLPLRLILFSSKYHKDYFIIYLNISTYSCYHYLLFFCLVWMMSLIWYSMKILLFLLNILCIFASCCSPWVN